MDGIFVPYLPTALWIFASALTILVLLVYFGHHWHFRNRRSALIEDEKKAATLASQIAIYEADEKAIRESIEIQRSELDRLISERETQEKLRAHLADLDQQCATKEEECRSLRKDAGELENQLHTHSERLESLKKQALTLEEKRGQADQIEKRLCDNEMKLEEMNAILKEGAVAKIEFEVLLQKRAALESQIDQLKSDLETAKIETNTQIEMARQAQQDASEIKEKVNLEKRKNEDLEFQNSKLSTTMADLKNKVGDLEAKREHAEALDQRLADLTEKAADARKELQILAREEVRLQNLIAEKITLESKIEDLKKQTEMAREAKKNFSNDVRKMDEEIQNRRNKLQTIQNQLSVFLAQQNERKSEVHTLEIQKSNLENKIGELEEQRNALAKKPDVDEQESYSDLIKGEVECLSIKRFSGANKNTDEFSALAELKEELKNEGFHFSDRVVNAFHTSLKCHHINPLTVLAGVSGTGKTLLPVKYAKRMGMHSLIMAVQPRWDSPQDMFGFYNYLEKTYKATDLARALIRMDPYNYPSKDFPDMASASDRMLMVLLDEMNLAKTEYYFSEFLSKLELRRLVNNPENEVDRTDAEVVLDTGPGISNRFKIWIEKNVLFVGTMNEDETTQSLSDKVLDRSNVLRFGRPTGSVNPRENNRENHRSGYLSMSTWEKWIKPFDPQAPWMGDVNQWISALNNALEKVGRPFGYRVQEVIGTYIANYPEVDEINFRLAFADQVEQKIIPKLRGIDSMEEKSQTALGEISQVIEQLDDEKLGKTFQAASEDKTTGLFIWPGVTR